MSFFIIKIRKPNSTCYKSIFHPILDFVIFLIVVRYPEPNISPIQCRSEPYFIFFDELENIFVRYGIHVSNDDKFLVVFL